MRKLSNATEDQVLFEFLLAEKEYRLKACNREVYDLLFSNGFPLDDRTMVDLVRRWLTSIRGWDTRTMLFTRFPNDVVWERWSFNAWELGCLKYLGNEPGWHENSNGTRLVSEYARCLHAKEKTNQKIEEIETAVFAGSALPLPILVTDGGTDHVILEGHHRITAYHLMYLKGISKVIEAYVWRSRDISGWYFYSSDPRR